VRRPPLLLADEPTGNLDESMAAEIIEALKDIGSSGTTIVLATHQARLAAALKRRTLTLDGGHVVKDEG
jgi:cell division transport system ATP-binding protein